MNRTNLTVITPDGIGDPWSEAWAYRELLYFTVWRDLRVRYRHIGLGAAWAIVQPFAMMVVLSLVLGLMAGVPADGAPYPVFSFAGLVPWIYFASAVTHGASSLVSIQDFVATVYFPRLIVPLAAVLVPLVDAVLAFAVLTLMMAWYGIAPGPALIALPAFVLLAVVFAASATTWLSALNVKYRDVRFVVPFLLQFGLFATPVAYPSSLVPEPWRGLYALNPMVTVVDGFRWALISTPAPTGVMLLASTCTVVVTLALGLQYFRRMERVFADVL